MNDILVFGKDWKEDDRKLRQGIRRLQAAGVTLNAKKCAFARNIIKVLGRILHSSGISADPEKNSVI